MSLMNTEYIQTWTNFISLFFISIIGITLTFTQTSFLLSFSHWISQGVLLILHFKHFSYLSLIFFLSIPTVGDQTSIISYLDYCPGLITPQSPNDTTSCCQINLFRALFWLYHSSIQKPSVILHCRPEVFRFLCKAFEALHDLIPSQTLYLPLLSFT